MSANAALLPCPVCSHAVFESTESLRDRLIFVSTNKILCPICQEEVTGIDKLTIHLFSHVKIVSSPTKNASAPKETKNKNKSASQSSPQNKKSKTTGNKTKPTASNAPVKYVRIYPKLPVVSVNAVPVLDMSRSSVNDQINVANSIYVPAVKTEGSIIQSKSNESICNICGLQFLNASILKMHRCLIHNIDENANTTFSRYQCHVCPKNFKMRGSLMVHMRVAHYGFQGHSNMETKDTNESEMSDTTKSNSNNIIVIEKCDNKQWQCDVCHKCFTTKYFLKKHKRLHTGETPYACAQCNKTFTFQQSYHKHLLYHNDEKPHVCSFCGRAFKELSTLHNHQRIHTGEKPFSCESCGKCFRQRVSYLVHRRIHTGVMPYKCTACEKSFRYKVSQRTHKCQAQPPGAVVRQTGELLEKLKKKHLDVSNNLKDIGIPQTSKCIDIYDSNSNAEMIISGARLSLEDTEKDNFMLLGPTFDEQMNNDNTGNIDNNDNNECKNINRSRNENKSLYSSSIDDLMQNIPIEDNNAPSPSEILRNLCLSSGQDNEPQENQDEIHDFFKELDFL